MTDERTINDAVHVALDRTREAQAEIEQELAERDAPDEQTAEAVVRRAEDLDVLVQEARDAAQET